MVKSRKKYTDITGVDHTYFYLGNLSAFNVAINPVEMNSKSISFF